MMDLGNILNGETPIDPSGLRPSLRRGPSAIRTRRQLNAIEAESIRPVVVKYLHLAPSRRKAPFTLRWIKRLHGEMFGRVWLWAGRIRDEELSLGAPPWQIDVGLQSMLDDVAAWQGAGVCVLEQAARLHHRAAQIHPFPNGNGRWARLLASIWQRQHGRPITLWPDADLVGAISAVRDEYIEALKAADGGSLSGLIGLHRRFLEGPKPHSSE